MLIVILLVFFGLFFIIWYVPPPGSARIPANTPMAHVSSSGMSIPGLGKRGIDAMAGTNPWNFSKKGKKKKTVYITHQKNLRLTPRFCLVR
jgi:hypothetical protein